MNPTRRWSAPPDRSSSTTDAQRPGSACVESSGNSCGCKKPLWRGDGAKSGELREVPLVALVEGRDLYVFASKGGAPTSPDWYFNLKATPQITVEFGTETYTATVTEMSEDEGQAKLRAQAELMPQFGEYIASAAPRVIPTFHIARNA